MNPSAILSLALIIPFVLTPFARAFQNPVRQPLANFDRRRDAAQPALVPAAAPNAAATALRARVPGVKVEFDPVTGSPRSIVSTEGLLSGPDGTGKGIPPIAARGYAANDPHRAIKAFLGEHAALFGHGAEVLDAARTKREFVTPHNGLRTTVWEQQLDDISVFEANLISHVTRNGELVSVASQFLPQLAAAADNGHRNRPALQIAPSISAPQALVLAAKGVGDDDDAGVTPLNAARPVGAEKRQQLRAKSVRNEADARLVWLPMNRTTMRLCWELIFTSQSRGEMFRVLIDAETGVAHLRQGLTAYITNATYRVYTSDSPSPFSPCHSLPSNAQPPFVSRELLVTSALNTNASPNGWIDDAVNETRGNNVDAHLDRNADNVADTPRPQGSPFRVFDFPFDVTMQPANYGNAAVVQLFYLCNRIHDRYYELGFTEAAGNFQLNNFGRGGLGNDSVQADAQDGEGFNNANFSTPPDGSSGRMQMYLFDGPTPRHDGDFDAEIVIHEYTHGLSNRRVGGGVGISALQTAGMGEGWSDFYALCLLSESGDDLNGNYAAGGYATYQFFGLQENYYFGIRRYPYSTDMRKNPLTFKDIDPAQIDAHVDIPRSPIVGGEDANEVHSQGEVWCVTLWEARANLINKHGFPAGNDLVLRLVTDGMNLSPANPNFLQARDAIIQADQLLTGGANQKELWAAFAKRGLGFNATSPNSATTSGVSEGFDLPDDLRVTPLAGITFFGPLGGPFLPQMQAFTLTDAGTNALDWSVRAGGLVTVSPASGHLIPGGPSITVTALLASVASSLPGGAFTDSITFSNHASSVTSARKVTLSVGDQDFFTQWFDSESNDLDNQTLTFTPDGSASFYNACHGITLAFPTAPAGGTPLSLSDDSFRQITLTGGAEVSLYGKRTNTFFVGSNGYITFDEGDTTYISSLFSHFLLPRVGGLFMDLDPGVGGTVSWKQLADRVAVTWLNVPEISSVNLNSFQIELFFDGTIRLTWLALASTRGLAGLSRGNGQPPAFAESDLSGYGPCQPVLRVTLPKNVSENSGLLAGAGAVSVPQPLDAELIVTLASSVASAVIVPFSVTIPAGQTNATFDLTIVDDGLLDGSQMARISASAAGYRDGSDFISVHDDEMATLAVTLPASAREGDGLLRGAGQVSVSAPPDRSVVVILRTGDTNELTLPSPSIVILPAGQTSAVFNVQVVDDQRIDGAQTASLIAHVENWIDGAGSMTVLDNDPAFLRLVLPAQLGESDGTRTNAGSVQLSGALPTNLVVTLASSDQTELIVPTTVSVAAGTTLAYFNLTLVDDTQLDGPQPATVTATAPGFIGTNATTTVADNEAPTAPNNPTPPHLASNTPIAITLSWIAGEDELLRNGSFETGDLAGWTRENSGTGDFIANNGTFDPESADGPLPPFAGGFSALAQQSSGGRHAIYQQVFIPGGATFATLSWADRVRNHAGHFASNHQFQVELRTTNNIVRAVLFRTSPDDPLLGDWVTRSLDLTEYRGQTIRLAFVEEDNLGYLGVHLDNVSLRAGAPAPTSFDVYFGATLALGPAQWLGATTNHFWELSPSLQPGRLYYWKVAARRGTAEAPGPVWQFKTRGSPIRVTLMPSNSIWRYLDNGSDQGTNWSAPGFDDNAWKTGRARLGYASSQTTTVSYGPDPNNKYITTYFRSYFAVTNRNGFVDLTVRLSRDDGGVVYLNGAEIFRSGMPLAPTNISRDTFAEFALDSFFYYPTNVDPGLLLEGTNVLAVEIHQATRTSSDLGFNLELAGNAIDNSNHPPSLMITNPAPDLLITTPAILIFSAAASDSDGTVTKVEFFVDGLKLGEDATPPYRVNWTGITPGLHVLTAVATDNAGATTVSEAVRVTVHSGAGIPISFVPGGSVWRYLDDGSNLGTTWQSTDFSDHDWPSGPAQLGYGDGDEATVTGHGLNPGSNYITTYFRHTFTNNATLTSSLTLNVLRDDGVVVFLNGLEVFRNNLPSGFIGHQTPASSDLNPPDESTWLSTSLNSSTLVEGRNVIAAEIHQFNATNSDSSFDLGLSGTGNFLPSVVLTSPANDAVFRQGQSVVLAASANDVYGTVRKVEFFQGDTYLGQSTNAPHTLAWSNLPPGLHELMAVASDNGGATNRSAVVMVAVLPGPALTATRAGDLLTLTWPALPVDFALESATNMNAPIFWSSVPNVATLFGGQFSVTLDATNEHRFFRLMKP